MLADACPENWRPHLLDTLNGDIGRHIQAQLNAESTGGYAYFPPGAIARRRSVAPQNRYHYLQYAE